MKKAILISGFLVGAFAAVDVVNTSVPALIPMPSTSIAPL